jgi:hypothetical protein
MWIKLHTYNRITFIRPIFFILLISEIRIHDLLLPRLMFIRFSSAIVPNTNAGPVKRSQIIKVKLLFNIKLFSQLPPSFFPRLQQFHEKDDKIYFFTFWWQFRGNCRTTTKTELLELIFPVTQWSRKWN